MLPFAISTTACQNQSSRYCRSSQHLTAIDAHPGRALELGANLSSRYGAFLMRLHVSRAVALGATSYVASCFGTYFVLVHLFSVQRSLAVLLLGVTIFATAPAFAGATLYSIRRRRMGPSQTAAPIAWNSMLAAAISWGLTATFSVAAVVVGTKGNVISAAILGGIAGLGAVFAARHAFSLFRSDS